VECSILFFLIEDVFNSQFSLRFFIFISIVISLEDKLEHSFLI